MAEYQFGSIVDRDFRLTLQRLADEVSTHGKTIQDLVADGQLSEEQYENLITVVNGLLKSGEVDRTDLSTELRSEVDKLRNKIDKGEVTVYDIDKNKGKFDQTYLTAELLEQIAGTASINAEPADGGVTNSKLANKAVDPSKTNFIDWSDNIVGKSDLLFRKIPDENGNMLYQVGRNTSKMIEVSEGTITFTGVIEVNEYDASKQFVKKTTYTSGTTNTITFDGSTVYVRFTITDTFIDTFQVNYGSELKPYDEYVPRKLSNDVELEENSVGKEHVDFITEEGLILNTDEMIDNTIINTSGVDSTHGGYKASDFIEVDQEENYTFVGVVRVLKYDANKDFLESLGTTPSLTYTMSFNSDFIRLVEDKGYEGDFKFNRGVELLATNEVKKSLLDKSLLDINYDDFSEFVGTGKPLNAQNEIYKNIVNSRPRYDLPQPMLVMTYDDNPITDYTLAFPVHQTHNVPGEIATISGFLKGEVPAVHPEPSMSIEQLHEMQDFGFEISTHSYSHLNLGSRSLVRNTLAGSNYWHVGSQNSFNRKFPFEAMVYHRLGDKNYEVITIVGEEYDAAEDRTALVSETPAQFDHTELGSTVFSLSEDELYREIVGSTQQLNNLGFNSSSIAYPYNSNSWHTRKIVAQNLSSGRAGDANRIGIDMDGTNGFIPTYALKSYAEITSWTEAEIDALLQEVKDNNSLATVFEHTWRGNFSPTGLDYIFTKCKELGVKVVTRKEALKHHGNRFEYGDYLRQQAAYIDPEPNFIINAYGKTFENIKD